MVLLTINISESVFLIQGKTPSNETARWGFEVPLLPEHVSRLVERSSIGRMCSKNVHTLCPIVVV